MKTRQRDQQKREDRIREDLRTISSIARFKIKNELDCDFAQIGEELKRDQSLERFFVQHGIILNGGGHGKKKDQRFKWLVPNLTDEQVADLLAPHVIKYRDEANQRAKAKKAQSQQMTNKELFDELTKERTPVNSITGKELIPADCGIECTCKADGSDCQYLDNCYFNSEKSNQVVVTETTVEDFMKEVNKSLEDMRAKINAIHEIVANEMKDALLEMQGKLCDLWSQLK
jgi:hypothetical protein